MPAWNGVFDNLLYFLHTMVQQLSTIVLSLSRELDHMSIVPDSYMEQTLNQSINQAINDLQLALMETV